MNTGGRIADPSSILVIYVSRIGDTMLITPAVRALAAKWPRARIDFFGSKTSAVVFQNLPFVAQASVLSKKKVRFQGRLQRPSYDLALVYGYDGDGPFVEYALRRAHQVVAFRQVKASLNGRLLAAVEKPAFQSCHAVDHFLSLLRPLSVPSAGRFLSYVVSPEEKQWAQEELAPLRAKHAAPLIGVQVASFPSKAYRDWPIERFVELCRRIRDEHPAAHFLILGGALEADRTRALHAAYPECSSHYAGRLSLRETAALINELDLYVGVDTGPTHIAGALRRPMVAMYHGYSPSRLLAPLEHRRLWVVDHPRAGHGSSPADFPMSDISVDTVLAKVDEALTAAR